MYRFGIIVFIILFLQFNVYAHKFYVSLTEIRLNDQQGSLEISIRIFPDDLDRALEAIYGINPHLATSREHQDADNWTEHYLKEKFGLWINNVRADCKFLGKQAEADAIWVFLEASITEIPVSIKINNSILTEVFKDQKNIVQVYYGDFNRGLLFDQLNISDSLNFCRKE